jgi:uncharacterized lipoprotein YmbA
MKRRVLFLLTAGALAGCAAPQAHYYQLAAMPGAVRGGTGLHIGVRSVGLPSALAQTGLPQPGSAYELNTYPNDLWAASLADMLQSTMVQNLSQRLPGDVVLADGGAIGATPDLYVEINILHFAPDQSGNVTLQAQLATRHATAQDFTVRDFTATAPGGTAPESLVAVMSTLWGQAADTLAAILP